MAGQIPTDTDLINFLRAVRPEVSNKYSATGVYNPQDLYTDVRSIFADPDMAQQAQQQLGPDVYNALRLRAPYLMGDRTMPSTFGQPTSKLRDVKQ